jgi:hypothetical protein
MTDGKTHFYYWRKGIKTLPLITLGVWLTTIPIYWGPGIERVLIILEMASMIYPFGAINDPDLDQPGISAAEGRMAKIPGLGYFLILYWTTYALLMSAIAKATKVSKGSLGSHRTRFTHSFWGTLIRIVWTKIPEIIIYNLLGLHISQEYIVDFVIASIIAFTYSDGIHYYHDGLLKLPTWRKQHG